MEVTQLATRHLRLLGSARVDQTQKVQSESGESEARLVQCFHSRRNIAAGGEQMVMPPVGSIETLYSKIGDAFGLAMLVRILGLVIVAWWKQERK